MTARLWLIGTMLGFASAANDQVFLITGNPQSDTVFDSSIFEVGEEGVTLQLDLLPSRGGAEWIAVSYDLRLAVVLPLDRSAPLTVIDLDTAAITKECVLPPVPDGASMVQHWVAAIPGRGPMFEWHLFRGANESWAGGMILNPSTPCEESFPEVAPTDLIHLISHGTSGIAGYGSSEGTIGLFDKEGKVTGLIAGTPFKFPYDPLPAALLKDYRISNIIVSNAVVFVVGIYGEDPSKNRAVVFRKGDHTWHVLDPPGGGIGHLRGFGRYISIVETRTKKAILAQRGRGHISIDMDVRFKERSPGGAEWRKEETAKGPNMGEAFAAAQHIYPGRLHLYDTETKQMRTIVTNQADSEVLLVENETFYYRVSDRLYSAPITATGFGPALLLAQDEAIRDAHWAFLKH